jgi:pimeloyl-ACP methyl ester carboxylesterase
MYYRESDSIVAKSPELAESIAALDEHLFINQDATIRTESTADLLAVEPHVLANLLALYEETGVVRSVSALICPKCDIPIEAEGATVQCDLCDKQFSSSALTKETVYRPRKTEYECGDDFSSEIRTSDDVEGIFRIVGCANADREMDVVFVHGLGGDAKQTWHPNGKPMDFWPKWIGEELPQIGVWSIDYEAAKTKWTGDALALPDRATDLLGRMELAGFGSRPIVFVTHSLGGLVVKQVLRHAREMAVPDWKAIADAARGIVFLATPHAGADLSGYLKAVSTFARPTAAIGDLQAHHERLRELNIWFRNNLQAMGVRIKVMYETKPTSGFLIVNATSADPGVNGVVPLPIESDHITICKPTSKSALAFLHTKRMIEKCLNAPAKP